MPWIDASNLPTYSFDKVLSFANLSFSIVLISNISIERLLVLRYLGKMSGWMGELPIFFQRVIRSLLLG